jgi:hypothetical protein
VTTHKKTLQEPELNGYQPLEACCAEYKSKEREKHPALCGPGTEAKLSCAAVAPKSTKRVKI